MSPRCFVPTAQLRFPCPRLRNEYGIAVDRVPSPITDRDKEFFYDVLRNVFQNNDRSVFSYRIDGPHQSVFLVAFYVQLNDSDIRDGRQDFIDCYHAYRYYIALHTFVVSVPCEDVGGAADGFPVLPRAHE